MRRRSERLFRLEKFADPAVGFGGRSEAFVGSEVELQALRFREVSRRLRGMSKCREARFRRLHPGLTPSASARRLNVVVRLAVQRGRLRRQQAEHPARVRARGLESPAPAPRRRCDAQAVGAGHFVTDR